MMSEKSILAVLDHPFIVQLGGTFQGVSLLDAHDSRRAPKALVTDAVWNALY